MTQFLCEAQRVINTYTIVHMSIHTEKRPLLCSQQKQNEQYYYFGSKETDNMEE